MDVKIKARKGQAAVEYLMTYGWALLVIAIVLVALYAVTQTQIRTEQCTIPTGFLCSDPMPQVFAGGSAQNPQVFLNIQVHNKNSQNVIVDAINCTIGTPQQVTYGQPTPPFSATNARILSGTSNKFTGIGCTATSGGVLNLQAGQQFSGYAVIWYHFENDIESNIKRSTIASISTTVAKQTT